MERRLKRTGSGSSGRDRSPRSRKERTASADSTDDGLLGAGLLPGGDNGGESPSLTDSEGVGTVALGAFAGSVAVFLYNSRRGN